MTIRHIKNIAAGTALTVLGVLGATSCADIDFQQPGAAGSDAQLVLNISVPNAEVRDRASRAMADEQAPTQNLEDKEGNIADLHIVLYDRNNTTGAPERVETVAATDITRADATITKEISELRMGTYKIYVLANVALLKDTSGASIDFDNISSSALDEFIMNLADGLQPDYLPMLYTGQVTIGATSQVVNANMRIAAVKLRLNVIFDPEIEGVDADLLPHSMTIMGATVTNIAKEAKLVRNTSYITSNLEATRLVEGVHYDVTGLEGSYYNASNSSTGSNVVAVKPGNAIPGVEVGGYLGKHWVWQATLYVPERYVAADGAATALNIEAALYDSNGSQMGDRTRTYTIANLGAWSGASAADDVKSMPRGTYYEVVGLLKNADILTASSITIQDWTVQTINAGLNGAPSTTFLTVESSVIGVETGKWTTFWFDTDADIAEVDAYLQSGEGFKTISVDGSPVPFFEAEVVKDAAGNYALNGEHHQIRIHIHDDVPFGLLNSMSEEDLKPYRYFYVAAGNLRKLIEVTPLTIKAVFTVDPQQIIIDMRELISSGLGSVSFDITYSTNVATNNITLSDPFGLLQGITENGTTALRLSGTAVSGTTLTNRNGKLTLTADGLMKGLDFWQSGHDFSVTLSLQVPGEAQPRKIPVTIVVRPYSSDYVIHFKSNKADAQWTDAHIYVYQALDLPSTASGKSRDNHNIADYAGWTVGYQIENDEENCNAALEYLFSNDIVFKGWDGYGGSVKFCDQSELYVYDKNGFVIISKGDGDKGRAFNAQYNNTEKYYYGDINLNESHRVNQGSWVCTKCQTRGNVYGTGDTHRMWPGIAMEPEDNGWWKYTLSGVATPGKTMIMFTDGHDGNLGRRFPDENQVGVPLFDFPDHEGWFLFDGYTSNKNQNFVDDEPESIDVTSKDRKYRFYWPKERGNQIYFESNSTEKAEWGTTVNTSDGDWYYFDFSSSKTSGKVNYKFCNFEKLPANGYGNNYTTDLSTFTEVSSVGRFCAYVSGTNWNSTSNEVKSGSPTAVVAPTYDYYLKGSMTSWEARDAYGFYADGTNNWRTDNFTWSNGKYDFKVGTKDGWDISLGEKDGAAIWVNDRYLTYNNAGSSNLEFNGTFSGYAKLEKVGDDWYLTLVGTGTEKPAPKTSFASGDIVQIKWDKRGSSGNVSGDGQNLYKIYVEYDDNSVASNPWSGNSAFDDSDSSTWYDPNSNYNTLYYKFTVTKTSQYLKVQPNNGSNSTCRKKINFSDVTYSGGIYYYDFVLSDYSKWEWN